VPPFEKIFISVKTWISWDARASALQEPTFSSSSSDNAAAAAPPDELAAMASSWEAATSASKAASLEPCNKYLAFIFIDLGPGCPGAPAGGPQNYLWAFPRPPRTSQTPLI
jgi:hypothetical protein